MFRIAAAPACRVPSVLTATGTRTAAARAGFARATKITTIKTA